jgi:hypothetical protein
MLADAIIVLIAVWVGAYLKGWGAAPIGELTPAEWLAKLRAVWG